MATPRTTSSDPYPNRPPHVSGMTCIAVLVGLAVLLGACSGDDTTETAESSPAPSATPQPAPPATTAPAATTTTTASPAGAPTEWCARARDVQAVGDEFDDLDSVDPDVVRAAVSGLHDSVAAASEVAPTDLVDAVRTQLEFAERLDEVLAEADYDMLTADLSILASYESDMEAAREAIRAYNVEFCGFEPEEVEEQEANEEDDFDFGDGSLRDQFVAQLVDDGFTEAEAECIFDEIDFSDPDSFDDDEAVTELLVACDVDLARIDELLEGGG